MSTTESWVPPLDIARSAAAKTLAQADALQASGAPDAAVYASWGALGMSLRLLLGALDKEDDK